MTTGSMKGYGSLEIYQEAHRLAVEIHGMTMKLPPFEAHEEGSQIRRSSKSVPAQIAEGYALRKYRDEFLHYLHRALASSDETPAHLRLLRDTKSLKDPQAFSSLSTGYETLSKRIASFIIGVERNHSLPRYLSGPAPKIKNQKSRIKQETLHA